MLSKKIWQQADKSRRRLLLLVSFPALLIFCLIIYYFYSARFISNENSYVTMAALQISPQISGIVKEVHIKNNQKVKAGELLFVIDQTSFIAQAEEAKAALNNAKIEVKEKIINYKIAQLNLHKANENLILARLEFDRAKKLIADKTISHNIYDQAKNHLDIAFDEVDIADKSLASALFAIENNPDIKLEDHPIYKEAKAKLDQAEQNLSYTVVKAPADGVIGNCYLETGSSVSAYYPLFSLIKNEQVWIESNFKETDIENIKPGQKVEIKIDTYQDLEFKGVVESITPATGAEFALLPAQNSSGNWVKVVQRIMVKINFTNYTGKEMLASGMSSSVTIDTKSLK